MAADRQPLPARGPADRPPGADPRPQPRRAGRADRKRHGAESRRRLRCAPTSWTCRTRGISRRSTARCTTSRAPIRSIRAEDYLVHITTGTHVAQICWFLLTEARIIPGRLLQTSPPRRGRDGTPGTHAIIDLDLSRYDRIATRFRAETAEATSFLKSGIETRNAAFNAMIEQIEQVAIRSKAPILLIGPTGAGKSQLARRIYELKHARHQIKGPFVEVNCATLRGERRCRRCSATSRAPSPAPWPIAPGCCARPTAASCSSTRSASSASTSRR